MVNLRGPSKRSQVVRRFRVEPGNLQPPLSQLKSMGQFLWQYYSIWRLKIRGLRKSPSRKDYSEIWGPSFQTDVGRWCNSCRCGGSVQKNKQLGYSVFSFYYWKFVLAKWLTVNELKLIKSHSEKRTLGLNKFLPFFIKCRKGWVINQSIIVNRTEDRWLGCW